MPFESLTVDDVAIDAIVNASFCLGIAICVSGFRFFRFYCVLLGLIGGSLLGWLVAIWMSEGNLGIATLAAICCGVIFSILLPLYKRTLGKLAWGATIGFGLAYLLNDLIGLDRSYAELAVPAIIFAISMISIPKHCVIMSTAIVGSCAISIVAVNVMSPLGTDSLSNVDIYNYSVGRIAAILAIAAGIAGASIYFQYVCSRVSGQPALEESETKPSPALKHKVKESQLEDRLNLIHRLHSQALISKEEYDLKRHEILKDL